MAHELHERGDDVTISAEEYKNISGYYYYLLETMKGIPDATVQLWATPRSCSCVSSRLTIFCVGRHMLLFFGFT